jgi:hypothetical protein
MGRAGHNREKIHVRAAFENVVDNGRASFIFDRDKRMDNV